MKSRRRLTTGSNGTFMKMQHSKILSDKSTDLSCDFPIIARIVKDNNSLRYRVAWALVLLLCLSLCTYQVWDRLSFYISRPISTSVRTIRNNTLYYPMLTACTMDTTGARHLRRKYERRAGVKACHYARPYELPVLQDTLDLNYTMIMKYVNISQNLNADCQLDTTNEDYLLWNNSWCNEIQSTSFLGSCISISARYSPMHSSQNIFSIEGVPPSNSCASPFLWVLIHEDILEVAFNSILKTDFFPIDFFPSVTERIPMEVSEFTYLNTPENPCTDEESYNGCVRNYFLTTIEAANLTCTFPFLGPSSLNICSSWVDLENANYALRNVFNPHKRPCPRKCHETIYRRGYGKTQHDPSEAFSISLEYLDNIVSVSEEYYAYNFVSMLCDLGGNVGLCLGISLITLFEALESFWNYFLARRKPVLTITYKH